MTRVFIFVLSLLLFSCNEEVKDLVVEQGYDFFPVKSGSYWIYEVHEIVYTGSVADSSHYYLKEVIADSILTGNQTNYLLEKYRSDDSAGGWQLDSVWTVRRNSKQAIVTENNIPFVKMTFPVKEGRVWDGNALNSKGQQDYRFATVENRPISGLDTTVVSVRVIIADIPANFVDQDQRSEVYAKGIGLVEKDYISVSFCQDGCPTGQVDDGRIFHQSLIAYGEE